MKLSDLPDNELFSHYVGLLKEQKSLEQMCKDGGIDWQVVSEPEPNDVAHRSELLGGRDVFERHAQRAHKAKMALMVQGTSAALNGLMTPIFPGNGLVATLVVGLMKINKDKYDKSCKLANMLELYEENQAALHAADWELKRRSPQSGYEPPARH